jgi:hypothetical protein
VARIGERKEACLVLVRGSEESRPLEKPRRRWEDNIKMDLQAVEWRVSDWIVLASNMACECGNKPSVSRKCRDFLDHMITC